jgi:hypothetical protein
VKETAMKAQATVRRPFVHRRALWVLAVPLLAAAAWLWAPAPAQAAGTVEVRFVEPERFTDIGFQTLDRERDLQEIAAHLHKLGQRLPEGQTLRIEVLDVDLAGHVWPRGIGELRILRGRADWPAISLRWTLQQGGETLASGEERITDMNYLTGIPPSVRLGALPYEKRMLARWFGERFEAGGPPH